MVGSLFVKKAVNLRFIIYITRIPNIDNPSSGFDTNLASAGADWGRIIENRQVTTLTTRGGRGQGGGGAPNRPRLGSNVFIRLTFTFLTL